MPSASSPSCTALEEIAARLVQVVAKDGASATMRLVALVLGIEDAQRIALQPVAAVLRELRLMAGEVVDQHLAIGGAALGVAERIELEHERSRTPRRAGCRRRRRSPRHRPAARATPRSSMPIWWNWRMAALLRPLVAEHRTGVEKFQRQMLGEAAGDQGARDAGGAFRPQA